MDPCPDIAIARGSADLDGLEDILHEYLDWDIGQLRAVSGVEIDPAAYVANTLCEIDVYFPPRGRLLLARDGARLVGIGFLKPLGGDTCEIKRMYVRPDQRGRGLGRGLLERLIAEARAIGYRRILLDSARYMTAAHRLYRALGFADIDYYPEGETDEALKAHLVYMELHL